MKNTIRLLALCILALPRFAHGQSAADSAAVMRAGLDYIEGFYEGDVDKLQRSVRPNVAKFGFWRARNATEFKPDTMSYAQFIDYAKGVKARGNGAPPNAPKDVKIIDMMDHIAAVKVTAWWGVDYLQIGKYDDRWMIAHVLWQSPSVAPRP